MFPPINVICLQLFCNFLQSFANCPSRVSSLGLAYHFLYFMSTHYIFPLYHLLKMYIFFTFFQADRQKYFFYIFNFLQDNVDFTNFHPCCIVFVALFMQSYYSYFRNKYFFYATFSEVLKIKEPTP